MVVRKKLRILWTLSSGSVGQFLGDLRKQAMFDGSDPEFCKDPNVAPVVRASKSLRFGAFNPHNM